MDRTVYIHDFSVISALGADVETTRSLLLSNDPPPVSGRWTLMDGRVVPAGQVPLLPDEKNFDSRCNAFAHHCLEKIDQRLIVGTDKSRLAVVIGTSSCGLLENGEAFRRRLADGRWPDGFNLGIQEFTNVADNIARMVGAQGPAYGISTACSSGAKALASGARLILSGMADVVLAGGFDALCDLTINGFASLEAISDDVSNPFSRNRRGINLGEGGALFVLSSEPSGLALTGWGESADAYHMSAPDPLGTGAEAAMRQALVRAGRQPSDVGYLNLHGTGTKLNDHMEALAVTRVFGSELPCSTTKPMTGHLLGAAGAVEAAFTLMAIECGCLPLQLWDGEVDPEIAPLHLVGAADRFQTIRSAMSCSYAFGGNNIALLLECRS
jgi:3-oxoacyl-[acyl-carrier-protein] synthase-1